MKIGDMVRVYNPIEGKDVSVGTLVDLQKLSNKKTNEVYSEYRGDNIKYSDAQLHAWVWIEEHYPFENPLAEPLDFDLDDISDFKFDLKKAFVLDAQDNTVSQYLIGKSTPNQIEDTFITFMQVSKVKGEE